MKPLGLAQRQVHLLHRDCLFPVHLAAIAVAQHRFQFVADGLLVTLVLDQIGKGPTDLAGGRFMPRPNQQDNQIADRFIGKRGAVGIL